jgi:hypothetical protein
VRTIDLASVFGATLWAFTGFAYAQGTGISANRDQGVTSNQCWDVSNNIIRQKNSTSAGAPSSEKVAPKTTVGSTGAGLGASGSTTSSGSASARPAGMPDC